MPQISFSYILLVLFILLIGVLRASTGYLSSSENVDSASTFKNTVSSIVSATGNTNEVPINTHQVAPSSVPVNTYSATPPSVPVNTYLVSPSDPITMCHVIPPNADPLAESFSQALSSIPAVQQFLTVPISVSELSKIFYAKTTRILVDIGYSNPHRVATRVSQPVNLFDVFTLPVLFKAIGTTFGKFLVNEGVDIPHNVSQLFYSYIENYIEANNVRNVDSLIEAVWFGSANFVKGLGFNLLEISDYISHLFFEEFTALKN